MGVDRVNDLRLALAARYIRFRISERRMARFVADLTGTAVPNERLAVFITKQLRELEQADLFKVADFIWENDNRSNTQKAIDQQRLDAHNGRHGE